MFLHFYKVDWLPQPGNQSTLWSYIPRSQEAGQGHNRGEAIVSNFEVALSSPWPTSTLLDSVATQRRQTGQSRPARSMALQTRTIADQKCSKEIQQSSNTSSGPEIPREGAEEPRCEEMPNASYI